MLVQSKRKLSICLKVIPDYIKYLKSIKPFSLVKYKIYFQFESQQQSNIGNRCNDIGSSIHSVTLLKYVNICRSMFDIVVCGVLKFDTEDSYLILINDKNVCK